MPHHVMSPRARENNENTTRLQRGGERAASQSAFGSAYRAVVRKVSEVVTACMRVQ